MRGGRPNTALVPTGVCRSAGADSTWASPALQPPPPQGRVAQQVLAQCGQSCGLRPRGQSTHRPQCPTQCRSERPYACAYAKTPFSAKALMAGSSGTLCKVPPAGFEPAHTAPEAPWERGNSAGHGPASDRSGGTSPRIVHSSSRHRFEQFVRSTVSSPFVLSLLSWSGSIGRARGF